MSEWQPSAVSLRRGRARLRVAGPSLTPCEGAAVVTALRRVAVDVVRLRLRPFQIMTLRLTPGDDV
ncbi:MULTISPECIES: hypothetical protein [unclassified Streptomyces]|uniref:hypothetical protein n=1 Tax=unclassified Streptomyces TaxID=2593676 RepID=UPI00225913ED|nr:MULTISPECIES: hypothetical protein [unclassified Streptomyces]WSP53495.1 hypothetical protein OG306_03100 [Streptomyces sp. NBC_01241]WSU25836.1 hypothetical protein OG508_36270 [Streptomyces sp. NBC_01108]MCX4784874.1 hypothetical protein [Streptomyces sp. NBC_01221]MCX4799173.1 hypothetical protein [Streptomyces sp. NBC_01242]WSJ40363.1 hypothetical protein OG772_33215 [Streptomyces sp. NBC_01321]